MTEPDVPSPEPRTEILSEPNRHRPPRKVTPRQFMIGSAALVVVLAGISGAAIELSGPHYKHPWCEGVENAIDNTHQTDNGYVRELAHARWHTRQLRSDLQALFLANAEEQNASDLNVLGQIANTEGALSVVGSDLRQIDRECGVPTWHAKHQAV